MCQCTNFKPPPALQRWIQEGYNLCFKFIEGNLVHLSDTSISYPILIIRPRPIPCVEDEIIMYVFCTPDGFYGHAVLPMHEEEIT